MILKIYLKIREQIFNSNNDQILYEYYKITKDKKVTPYILQIKNPKNLKNLINYAIDVKTDFKEIRNLLIKEYKNSLSKFYIQTEIEKYIKAFSQSENVKELALLCPKLALTYYMYNKNVSSKIKDLIASSYYTLHDALTYRLDEYLLNHLEQLCDNQKYVINDLLNLVLNHGYEPQLMRILSKLTDRYCDNYIVQKILIKYGYNKQMTELLLKCCYSFENLLRFIVKSNIYNYQIRTEDIMRCVKCKVRCKISQFLIYNS